MKKLIAAALGLSLLAGTAASAQPYGYQDYSNRREVQQDRRELKQDRREMRQDRKEARRWARGQRLPANYYTRSHYVDYRRHHLRAPPRGYQWVQVDNNYALVALASGLISQIIANR